MQDEMNVEQPHSIWLCPENAACHDFQDTINDIAEQQGTAPFAPHVTLLGDIKGPPQITEAFCRKVFARQAAVHVKSKGLAMTDRFFMSLFLDLDVPSHVFDLRADLAMALGLDVSATFRPHLSLAYGLERPAQARYFAHIGPSVSKRKKFFLDSVVIAASSSCLPITAWKSLSKIDIVRG